MSECRNGELRDLLPELANGRLDAETQREVEAHVAACEECGDELALLRALKPALMRAAVVDVERIAAAVQARTAESRGHGRGRVSLQTRFAIAAAALIAATAFGYAILNRAHVVPEVAVVHERPVLSRESGGAQHAVAPAPAPAPLVTPPHGVTVQPEQRVAVTPPATAPMAVLASVGVLDNVSDLSDDDLRTLSASLDGVSSVPDVDPAPDVDPLGASLDDQSAGGI
jgi:anti-sigma factor RsiW